MNDLPGGINDAMKSTIGRFQCVLNCMELLLEKIYKANT
jgi:hypothetical protein